MPPRVSLLLWCCRYRVPGESAGLTEQYRHHDHRLEVTRNVLELEDGRGIAHDGVPGKYRPTFKTAWKVIDPRRRYPTAATPPPLPRRRYPTPPPATPHQPPPLGYCRPPRMMATSSGDVPWVLWKQMW